MQLEPSHGDAQPGLLTEASAPSGLLLIATSCVVSRMIVAQPEQSNRIKINTKFIPFSTRSARRSVCR